MFRNLASALAFAILFSSLGFAQSQGIAPSLSNPELQQFAASYLRLRLKTEGSSADDLARAQAFRYYIYGLLDSEMSLSNHGEDSKKLRDCMAGESEFSMTDKLAKLIVDSPSSRAVLAPTRILVGVNIICSVQSRK
jgi:hypothetical protein